MRLLSPNLQRGYVPYVDKPDAVIHDTCDGKHAPLVDCSDSWQLRIA